MKPYVIVGMGIQGQKRAQSVGADHVISVDPLVLDADFAGLDGVDLSAFDTALVCTPDSEKLEIVEWLIRNGKNVLVEKPFLISRKSFERLEQVRSRFGTTVYVAYNHRFEPHVQTIKKLIDEGSIGEIYTAKLHYGNGTAEIVRTSRWKDSGSGVIADLGSHLVDLVAYFWTLDGAQIEFVEAKRHENLALDSVRILVDTKPKVWLEASLLSWKNSFEIDIVGSRGSVHLSGLCKWGPSTLSIRHRVSPSGVPPEEIMTLLQTDPTWASEFTHLKHLVKSKESGNLEESVLISELLKTANEMGESNP